jgi:hypothetical protein
MMIEVVGRERGCERKKNQYDEPRGTDFRDRMVTQAPNKMRSYPTVHASHHEQDSCWKNESLALKNSRTYQTVASARAGRRDIIVSLCPSATILLPSADRPTIAASSVNSHEMDCCDLRAS